MKKTTREVHSPVQMPKVKFPKLPSSKPVIPRSPKLPKPGVLKPIK